MLLLRSWQESLKLFLPANFKLFMLTVLKSAVETYGYLAYYFWWLILIVAISSIGEMAPEFFVAGINWTEYIYWITEPLVWLVLIILVRPSVREKGFTYFKAEAQKIVLGFFAYIFFWGTFWGYDIGSSAFGLNVRYYIGNAWLWLIYEVGLLEQYVANVPIVSTILQVKNLAFYVYAVVTYFWMPLILVPVFLYSVLFFADSEGSVRAWFGSLWRAVKMVLYNWPFFFISILVLWLLFWLIVIRLSFLFTSSTMAAALIFFCLQPLLVTYFKNFYVKRVHDQFKLYFPRA